jgi:hypothetical protein
MFGGPGVTFSEKYDLAMSLVDQGDADRYFERLVEGTMSEGKTREEAEKIERSNIGYYAGYHLDETRERVERLFRCAHPIFGSIAENGPPSIEQIREVSGPYLADFIQKVRALGQR